MLNLDQATALVRGRPDFTIKTAPEGYVAVDYVYVAPDTFADPRRRNLRGTKFCSKTGELLALPFDKFFNVGEKPETQLGSLPWYRPHYVLEKLDGSMIHALVLGDRVRLMTRMGLTDTALACEQLWGDAVQRWRPLIEAGLTPVFEWVGPRNPHIIRYPRDQLILTALRDRLTGTYYGYDALQDSGDRLGFQTVRRLLQHPGCGELRALNFVETIRARSAPDEEGVVIVWDHADLRVKVKTEAYVRLHRARDGLRFEKDTLALVLHHQLDDVLAALSSEARVAVTDYEMAVWSAIERAANQIELKVLGSGDFTRKGVALEIAPAIPAPLRPAFWRAFDGMDPIEAVRSSALGWTSSGPRLTAALDQLPHWPRWRGLNLGDGA